MQRKQAKRDKLERQQAEVIRLQELLQLQTLLDTLGDDAVRQKLRNAKDIVVTEENFTQLDEFYQFVAPSRDDQDDSLRGKLQSAAEHLQLYLERSDRAVVGVTYCVVHDLVDNIDSSHCLTSPDITGTAAAAAVAAATAAAAAASAAAAAAAVGAEQSGVAAGEKDELDVDNCAERRAKRTESSSNILSSSLSAAVSTLPQTYSLPPPLATTVSPGVSGLLAGVTDPPPVSVRLTDTDAPSTLPSGFPLPDQWSAVATNSAVFDAPASFYHGVGASFNAQQLQQAPAQQQRPLPDVVSAMQGNFHFLQDSQIDLDNAALLATSSFMFANCAVNASLSSSMNQLPHDSPNLATGHASSPRHFASTSLYQPTSFYAASEPLQHMSPVAFSFTDAHQGAVMYLAADGVSGYLSGEGPAGSGASEEPCPEPIPLPSEVLHGQSLSNQHLGSTPSAGFALNTGASVFRSVYEQSNVTQTAPGAAVTSSAPLSVSGVVRPRATTQQTGAAGSHYPVSGQVAFSAAIGGNSMPGRSTVPRRPLDHPASPSRAAATADSGFITVGRAGGSRASYNSSRGGYAGQRAAAAAAAASQRSTGGMQRGGSYATGGRGSAGSQGTGYSGGGRESNARGHSGGFGQRPNVAQHSAV